MPKRTPVPDQFRSTGPTATEKQLDYLRALRDGKDLSSLNEIQIVWLNETDMSFPSELPKDRVSQVIEQLVPLPWKKRGGTDGPESFDVEDGRYAIEKIDGTLMFYSVKNGRYKTFVDVWASDARWPVQNPQEVKRILEAIKADPDAGPRFGREIGRCWVCGRTLTDELSRSLGIGPVCRGS
jgi:hypothetical protein